MGNRPLRGGAGTGDIPRREVRTLEKLKHDVELANALAGWPSAATLRGLGDAVGVGFVATLRFRLLCSQRVSRAMLPVIWKFNRNVLVEAAWGGPGGAAPRDAAHFTPLQFYTVLKCLRDIHREVSALENKGDTGDGNNGDNA